MRCRGRECIYNARVATLATYAGYFGASHAVVAGLFGMRKCGLCIDVHNYSVRVWVQVEQRFESWKPINLSDYISVNENVKSIININLIG